MAEVLVITCPSGKQCSRFIPLVYNKGRFTLRLAAHSQNSAEKLQAQYPDAEVVRVDLQSFPDCRKLLHGATAINAVLPSLHSREKEIGLNLVDAAVIESQRAGNQFKHFVLSSVLCTQHRNLIQHDLKSYVEERIFLSSLECWTILKPTNFMDTFPVAMLAAQDKPVLEKWWAPEYQNSVINLQDFAEVTAKVLNEREAHYLAEYPLCSTKPISDLEIVKLVEQRIGKSIEVKVPSLEAGTTKLLVTLFDNKPGVGLASDDDMRSDLVRDTAERLILFYNHHGLKGSPNVMRWLLEREPTTMEQWIDSVLSK